MTEYNVAPHLVGTLIFTGSGTEMLRIAPDGFYVRGVKIEQGPGEAKAVYDAVLALCGLQPLSEGKER